MNKHYRTENNCLNCGSVVQGKFCSNCGQENLQLHESFWHLISHSVGHYFHFDSKFFNSVPALLTKPGYLTLEYNAGKRASHLPPVSMYIFISFLFFLLNGTVNKFEINQSKPLKEGTVIDDDVSEKKALKKFEFFNADSTLEAYQNKQKALPKEKRDNLLESYITQKTIEYGSDSKREAFREALVHNIPKIMFILLPLFALILFLLYYRHHVYYVEHIIYTIHLHSFIFLFLSIVFLIELAVPRASSILDFISFLIIMWYVYRSLRVVYKNSRRKTIFKLFFLSTSYLLFVIISFLVVIAATVLMV